MTYDKYKPTEIELLNSIPSTWTVGRLKDISIINEKSLTDKISKDYQFKYIDIGNVNQNGIIQEPEMIIFSEAPSRARRIVRKNDIIISTVRTYLKAIAFIDFYPKGYIASTGFAVVTPNKKVDAKYLSYYSQSELFVDLVIRFSTGVSYPAINSTALSCLYVYLPPNDEQTAIAHYLDTKTLAIDNKIRLLNQKTDYYKELRKSIINDAVCKGLDKNVELKESEAGVTPLHWRIGRIKDISKTMGSGATPLTNIASYYQNGVLNWVNTGDLNDGIIESCQYRISKSAIRDYPNLKINKIGTLLVAMYGATICKIGLLDIEATTNQACCCINFKKNSVSKFVFYWFLAKKKKIISLSVGGTQPNISQGIIAKLLIAIPPFEEQMAIAKYLDRNTEKIDAIIANIRKQIETLTELRKTLINDVVTGKIKVTIN